MELLPCVDKELYALHFNVLSNRENLTFFVDVLRGSGCVTASDCPQAMILDDLEPLDCTLEFRPYREPDWSTEAKNRSDKCLVSK
jgi:hypothetical protein